MHRRQGPALPADPCVPQGLKPWLLSAAGQPRTFAQQVDVHRLASSAVQLSRTLAAHHGLQEGLVGRVCHRPRLACMAVVHEHTRSWRVDLQASMRQATCRQAAASAGPGR